MEISLNARSGFELIIKAENVKIVEDIEELTYKYSDDGKLLSVFPIERDIKEQPIMDIINVLDEIMYRRVKEIDSSILIENLFTKLPINIASDLAQKLNKDYKL